MSWREYWNADNPIYVNGRHRRLHYRRIADDRIRLIGELCPATPGGSALRALLPLFGAAGLRAHRHGWNMGHNPWRQAWVATAAQGGAAPAKVHTRWATKLQSITPVVTTCAARYGTPVRAIAGIGLPAIQEAGNDAAEDVATECGGDGSGDAALDQGDEHAVVRERGEEAHSAEDDPLAQEGHRRQVEVAAADAPPPRRSVSSA